ncbi:MAG: hypothetical protein AB7G37_12200, partial [Solirubrobacteraceae bacterium]
RRLGRYVKLQDVYGNTYTYANLESVPRHYAVPKDEKLLNKARQGLERPGSDPAPTQAASAGTPEPGSAAARASKSKAPATASDVGTTPDAAPETGGKERVFANPTRPTPKRNGGAEQIAEQELARGGYSSYVAQLNGLPREQITLKRLRKGSRVMAGTVLGRLGEAEGDRSARLRFLVRPAGKGAPLIDPKPILDGWKLLESTAVYRAKGSNPLFGSADGAATAGQVLLMSKEQLIERTLADPNLDIYAQGRTSIQAGQIDRRVLGSLQYLTANGLKLGISSLKRPGSITSAGNVSEHASGNAVDIASVNGVRIERSSQGQGSITDQTIRLLLQLQGAMKPHQIISLMTYTGSDNTMSLPDHDDHIHVGYRPQFAGDGKLGKQVTQILKPGQWIKLIDRIGQIENPTVLDTPSKYAIKGDAAGGRAAGERDGE